MQTGLEWITGEQLDRACKRQEKKNCRQKQQSTSWVSMLHYVQDLIIEVRDNCLLIKVGWRERIKSID